MANKAVLLAGSAYFCGMEKGQDTGAILERLGIEALNEMQLAAGEAINSHNQVVLLSDTGSGKTLAFLLPLLPLLQNAGGHTRAMIIVPSRELALQIESVFRSMGTGIKVTCCYGGHKREIEENSLVQPPALLIGTPGRLADHIRRDNLDLETIEVLVLDEFDKSLELGFVEEISFIRAALPALRKQVLTSATEAVEIPSFLQLDEPQRLNFLSGKPKEALAIRVVHANGKDKIDALFNLLCALGGRPTIIFFNHRESVERGSALLSEKGMINVYYHGAMEQKDREVALAKFRNGSVYFLLTTDLAARGLDIPNIRYIIHYHVPTTAEIFTHRNGRTARVEASGTAILLLGPEEKVPDYIVEEVEPMQLQEGKGVPEKSSWTTLFIGAGKKNKVNKVDIVGFLTNKGELKKEDIGLIEVKDFFSFVAVRRSRVSHMLQLIKGEKLKKEKVKIDVAR